MSQYDQAPFTNLIANSAKFYSVPDLLGHFALKC